MSNLTELLARVEAATGPDRITDAMIARDVAGLCLHGSWSSEGPESDRGRHCDDCGADSWGNLGKTGQRLNDPIPAYTASIDAPLVLKDRLLPGQAAAIGDMAFTEHPRGPWAMIWTPDGEPKFHAEAATPPLAIIAAMLKALIARSSQP